MKITERHLRSVIRDIINESRNEENINEIFGMFDKKEDDLFDNDTTSLRIRYLVKLGLENFNEEKAKKEIEEIRQSKSKNATIVHPFFGLKRNLTDKEKAVAEDAIKSARAISAEAVDRDLK